MVKRKRPNTSASLQDDTSKTEEAAGMSSTSEVMIISPMALQGAAPTSGERIPLGSGITVGPAQSQSTDGNADEKKDRFPIFKDPSFVHSNKSGQAAYKRTRVWKNLKQIVTAERVLPWKPSDVTFAALEAPPSFRPAKKYSDVSGLLAKYTDPQTKLFYTSGEEFSRIRMLPADLVTGYLALRKANAPVP